MKFRPKRVLSSILQALGLYGLYFPIQQIFQIPIWVGVCWAAGGCLIVWGKFLELKSRLEE